MPAKYHIHTHPAPPRFRPVGKFGIVDWREDCASCHNCVKRACAYGFYREEADTLHDEVGYLDYIYQCKGCLSCVQDCTKGILTRVVNPEYKRIGDSYYTPAILLATWYQADTGRIPVSGAGYGGPFTGSGFDSSTRGGSFLGKKNSSSSRKRDLYRGSSKCLSVISRFSSGSPPDEFALTGSDPIVPLDENTTVPET